MLMVFGFPRSGTTWFANLINSHPSVIYRHEPLARMDYLIDEGVYRALKEDGGLSDADREHVIRQLARARPECDRPPFFPKNHHNVPISLQKMLWLGASVSEPLVSLYERMMRPKVAGDAVLLVKETGWSVHLESILLGLRPTLPIFLLRHPCAVASSHVEGIRLGLMRQPIVDQRRAWYSYHASQPFLGVHGITEDVLENMSEVEFLALKWRVVADIYLSCMTKYPGSRIVIYEDLVADPLGSLRPIFEAVNLSMGSETTRFVVASNSDRSPRLRNPLKADGSHAFYSVYRSAEFSSKAWESRLSRVEIEAVKEAARFEDLEQMWTESPVRRFVGAA